jgi:Na+/proline symporter/signal transduction histidine kinase/CheY-like chemotaxis protein
VDSPSYLLILAVLYVCALFLVAWAIDRRSHSEAAGLSPRMRALIYALSLGVYCSSWTFYGAVGSATVSPWSHAPIYLGPIAVFVFAWPFLQRLRELGVRHRVTSIADYFAARFGKRQGLSTLVTLVAVAAVLPYIALQFRALSQAWLIVAGDTGVSSPAPGGSSLMIAVALGAFAILFGARRMDGRERHQGLMSAIALESIVKLLAFMLVALLALVYLRRPEIAPLADWSLQSPANLQFDADFVTRTLISACAIFCLPRQFHVMVVEASGAESTLSRWVLPGYLLLFMLLVVPISLAGSLLASSGSVTTLSPDAYVQWLPAALKQDWISIVAFVGGISAATGMVIVATVALAIMITNEIAVPMLIRSRWDSGADLLSLGDRLRRVRQITIGIILAAAWLVSTQLRDIPWLSEIGFMSFLAAAQLAPGLLAGLYWRRAHGVAVGAGLLAGLLLWLYCLVLPGVMTPDHALLSNGPLGAVWLRPQALLGWEGPGPLSYAALWSLGINAVLLVLLSRVLRPAHADIRQGRVFISRDRIDGDSDSAFDLSPVRAAQLRALLPPFLDASRMQQLWRSFEERYQQRLLPADRVPLFAVREAESVLAEAIGAASAARVINELTESRQLDFSDLASLVSDASRQQTFNRELLETTVESMLQGVSVLDSELCLVAWNTRFEQIFDYPERMLYVGMPVARLYRYNAERGVMGVGEQSIDDEVEKRIAWLRQGKQHRFERRLPDGRVLDIHVTPTPRGGFVNTYIDISDYREMLTQLEESRLELESRVEIGSQSLAETNAELRRENRLRAEAEAKLRDANLSKSRFMSATSHDLLQPINAARLFTASLRPGIVEGDPSHTTIDRIDQSLGRAEHLIEELREIARLDSGRQTPDISAFAADGVLRELYAEFAPIAQQKGLQLRLRSSSLWLRSDRKLVFRILQNLVGNAIKYSRAGRVLIGVRRRSTGVEIQVLDQGPGIADEDRARVFAEFERLGQGAGEEEGLGLGLAIVSRYAALLEHPLRLRSDPGRGSLFAVTVPAGVAVSDSSAVEPIMPAGRLDGVRILCIDNDARVREALAAMLTSEGGDVQVVADRHELREGLKRPVDVIVADYHLDDGDTGIEALRWAAAPRGLNVPCIIVSADDGVAVREMAQRAGYRSLPKPVNPARLTALILALTRTAA